MKDVERLGCIGKTWSPLALPREQLTWGRVVLIGRLDAPQTQKPPHHGSQDLFKQLLSRDSRSLQGPSQVKVIDPQKSKVGFALMSEPGAGDGMGSSYLMNGATVSVGTDEKYPEVDGGDGCTVECICSMPPNFALTNGYDGKFCYLYLWQVKI